MGLVVRWALAGRRGYSAGRWGRGRTPW